MLAPLLIALALSADPLLVVEPVRDVGPHRIGQPLEAKYQLKNVGSEPIAITELAASCGCASPRISNRSIMPQGMVEITLDVNTLSQPPGPIRWTLGIGWQSGSQSGRASAELTARLIREIELTPAALVLAAGNGLTHDVRLVDHRAKPLKVTGIATDSPRLLGQLLPERDGQAGRVVRLRVADDCPEGRHTDSLRIRTDDPSYRELVVPVTLVREARARVSVSPARASLELHGPSLLLQLRDRDGEPVVVEKIESDLPGLTSKFAAGPGNFSTIRLSLDPATAKPGEGSVRVQLRSPAGEIANIPVTVRGR